MGIGGFAGALGAFAPVAAIANGAVDVWSANEDRKAIRDANNANIANAREANQWSENLSNTSYQRAMKDMHAAGLNPMLAFSQGGAATPSAQTAVSQAASKGGMGRAVSKNIEGGISTAMNAQRLSNETAANSSNIALQSTQGNLNNANANSAASTVKLNAANEALARTNAVKAKTEARVMAERNARESSRWDAEKQTMDVERDIKKIDREYRETDKWADYVQKGASAVSGFLNPFKGYLPPLPNQKGGTDYPTGNSGKSQSQMPSNPPGRPYITGRDGQKLYRQDDGTFK